MFIWHPWVRIWYVREAVISISESTRSMGHVRNLPWSTPAVVDDIPMTESAAPPATPYGSWPSPISAVDVAKGQVLISYPIVIGDDVWWQEGRPDEGGRVTVIHGDAAGHQQALLPAPWNARSRVHEYGGRSYLPVPGRPRDGSTAAA